MKGDLYPYMFYFWLVIYQGYTATIFSVRDVEERLMLFSNA